MKRSRALELLGIAAGVGVTGTAARAADVVRFASIPIDGGAQAWYAQEQGYFREAGIDAQIEANTNGGAIAAAVIGGALEVGYAAITAVITAHEKGIPVSVIAPAGLYLSSAPISSLMVPVDSPAKNAKDLNGGLVAVNGLKNITQIATEAWSDANGGDWKSLRFTEMPLPSMPAALSAHRIDAAFIAEPVVSDALRQKNARVIGTPYDAIAPQFTISVWFTQTAWAKANPGLVRRIGGAIRQASTWANTHDAQSAQILSAVSKIPASAIEGTTRSRFSETLSARSLQPVIEVSARFGLLTKSFPAADIIDQNAT